jgi:hypothetical protein
MSITMLLRQRGSRWGLLLCLGMQLVGCAYTKEKISSRSFREKPFATLFSKEEPMLVLREKSEGDARIRAMQNLKEPARNGGSQQDQEEAIKILEQTVTMDSSGLCRLTALETLSQFQDPRVPEILVRAYHHSQGVEVASATMNEIVPVGLQGRLKKNATPFTPETITTLQSRSLESLGKTRSEEGLKLLCEVAAKPAKRKEAKEDDLFPEPDEGVNQFDIRLAAIRSLGEYRGEPRAAAALYQVLSQEKDVALKNRAHEGLKKVTGQNFPPNLEMWKNWLDQAVPHGGPVAPPVSQNPIQPVSGIR